MYHVFFVCLFVLQEAEQSAESHYKAKSKSRGAAESGDNSLCGHHYEYE